MTWDTEDHLQRKVFSNYPFYSLFSAHCPGFRSFHISHARSVIIRIPVMNWVMDSLSKLFWLLSGCHWAAMHIYRVYPLVCWWQGSRGEGERNQFDYDSWRLLILLSDLMVPVNSCLTFILPLFKSHLVKLMAANSMEPKQQGQSFLYRGGQEIKLSKKILGVESAKKERRNKRGKEKIL